MVMVRMAGCHGQLVSCHGQDLVIMVRMVGGQYHGQDDFVSWSG